MKRLIHQIGWQVASNVGVALIAAAYVLFLGATLGATNFGLFALALAVPTFAFAAADLRIQEATTRFLVQQSDAARCAHYLRYLWRVDVLARCLVVVLLVLATPLLAKWLMRDVAHAPLVITAVLGMFASKLANAPAVGVLRACDLFGWHARLLLVSWLVKLAITLVAVSVLGWGVFAVVAISVGVDAVANYLTWLRARAAARAQGWLVPLAEHAALTREERGVIKRFLASSFGISASDSLLRELDTALVGALLSLPAVGVYRMAKNIVQMIWRVVDPVYIVLMPEFTRHLAAGDDARVDRHGRIISLSTFGVVIVIIATMWLALPYVVPVLLGPSFSGLSQACLIMSVGVALGGPFIWVHAAWIAAGRPDRQLIAIFSGAVVAGIAYLTLTPRFDVMGAAAAFAISLSLPFLISRVLWHNRRRQK